MPWHVENDAKIGYCARPIEVPREHLHLLKPKEKDEEIQLSNMIVKMFRGLLRKNYGSHKLQLFACLNASFFAFGAQARESFKNAELKRRLEKYKCCVPSTFFEFPYFFIISSLSLS